MCHVFSLQVSVRYCQSDVALQDVWGREVVSTNCDLFVVRELGYGMTRGEMDRERPFLGQYRYTPPDRQEVGTSKRETPSEVTREQCLRSTEVFALD